MSLHELTELSRYYGSNGDYVLAGGGNTSWKDGDILYVKASGFSLAEVCKDSFVKMDRKVLARIWDKKYPEESEERESAVLTDMMAARKPGEEQKRPSVETLLHDIMPYNYTVHLHPALVNGLTCSQQGEIASKDLFSDKAIWIPSINPGYVLAVNVKKSLELYYKKHRKQAPIIFLQNHGVFVSADNAQGIMDLYIEIMEKINDFIVRKPDFSDEKLLTGENITDGITPMSEIIQILKELSGAVAFITGSEYLAFLKDRTSFAAVSSAFTPDHIVYAGSNPLFTEELTGEGVRNAWKNHTEVTGRIPKIIAIQRLGIFSAASTEKEAKLALELFKDTVKVAVFSESFGGPLFMTKDKIDFINNWEVERYRSRVAILSNR